MPTDLSFELQRTIDRELPHLQALGVSNSMRKPAGPESWSPRQELGHLIDSAANNHIRFMRASIEPDLQGPGYAQNAWVEMHAYQDMAWNTIVEFWHQYNSFISRLLRQIPEDKLNTRCCIGNNAPVPLSFLITDYILHLQHHVDHLLNRPVVTQYPAS